MMLTSEQRALITMLLGAPPAGGSDPGGAVGGGSDRQSAPGDPPADAGVADSQVHVAQGGGSADIFFAFKSGALTSSAHTALAAAAEQCTAPGASVAPGGVQITCAASLDENDDDASNLCEDRGEAVRDFLVDHGVAAALIRIDNVGAVDTFSKTDQAANRFVLATWLLQGGGNVPPPPPDDREALPSRIDDDQGNSGRGAIFFATGSDQLTPSANTVLKQILAELKAAAPGQVNVSVEGAADLDGEAGDNVALSRRRAAAVEAWLVAQGIPEAAVAVTAVGGTDHYSNTIKAENRRATVQWRVFEAVPGGGGRGGARAAEYQKTALGGHGQLYFDAGTVELSGSARTLIARCAQECTAAGAMLDKDAIMVAAYAALAGDTDRDPVQLARDRADVVKDQLLAGGLDPGVIASYAEATDKFSGSDASANMLVILDWHCRPKLDPVGPGGGPASGAAGGPAGGGSAGTAGADPAGTVGAPGSGNAGSGTAAPPGASDAEPTEALESRITQFNPDSGAAEIFFASGSKEMSATAFLVLMQVVSHCQGAKTCMVIVESFADLSGDPATNQSLSQARADAVEHLMVFSGLEEAKVDTFPQGGTDKFSKTEKARNRVALLRWRLEEPQPGGGGSGGARPSSAHETSTGGHAILYFDTGSVELSGSAQTAMKLCLAACTASGVVLAAGAVKIVAYASESGDAQGDPAQLAKDRGEVTRDFLTQRGVDAKACTVSSFAADHFSKTDHTANQVAIVSWQTSSAAPPGPPPPKAGAVYDRFDFGPGATALDAKAKARIRAMGDLSTAKSITVGGYSSTDGKPEINQRLSEQRAQAVVDYLLRMGARQDVISAKGHGGTDEFSKDTPGDNRVATVSVTF